MKAKQKQALHAMKPEELKKTIADAAAALAAFMVNRYSKQSKNVREGRGLRRKIAVAKTILTMKELTA